MIRITWTDQLGKHSVVGSNKIKLQDVVIKLQKANIEFKMERIPNEPKH